MGGAKLGDEYDIFGRIIRRRLCKVGIERTVLLSDRNDRPVRNGYYTFLAYDIEFSRLNSGP